MNIRTFLIASFCVFSLSIASASENSFSVHSTPGTYRKVQFENDYAKAWKIEIAPHESLEMHRYDYPYVVIGLKGGTLQRTLADGSQSTSLIETNRAYWHEADSKSKLHQDKNNSDRPIELVVIEIKKPAP